MKTTITQAEHDQIVAALRTQHGARVTDLLEANNRYQEEAREARRELRAAQAEIEQMHQDAAGASI